ncbi:MAG: cytochrome c [Rhodospirillales bacterium]|nr:cytochrome c [Rhodospirillales bacterium]
MSTRNGLFVAVALALAAFPLTNVAAQSPPAPRFGTSATPAEIAGWNIDVTPNGAGLPPGSGTASVGAKLFAANCATCHGAEGQGIPVPGHGVYPRLVGGIGTLKNNLPIKTVGSFWPYATGVFDYIRRAMPFTHPQSLTADQVYALTAFILWKNGIIVEDATMDAHTLPAVKMPNAHGFFTRPPPETANIAPIETPPFRPSP